jgi:hypothetical protein
VIIRDFNVVRVSVHPLETNPPLRIDANAMLSFAVATQSFQSVSGRNPQVFEPNFGVHQLQFVKRVLLNVAGKLPG